MKNVAERIEELARLTSSPYFTGTTKLVINGQAKVFTKNAILQLKAEHPIDLRVYMSTGNGLTTVVIRTTTAHDALGRI